MAYLFIDDEFPEVEEYATNFIYFNEKEPGALKRMMQKCVRSSQNSAQKGYEILKDDEPGLLQFA